MEKNMATAAEEAVAAADSAVVSEEVVPQKKQRKPINQQKLQDNIWGWAFCLPLIVGTCLFVYVALIMAVLLSFTTYNGASVANGTVWDFLGVMFSGGKLANGFDVFTDPATEIADPLRWYKFIFTYENYSSNAAINIGKINVTGALLFNTVFYAIGIPIGMVLAMFFAVCMSRDIKGGNLFRVLYYLPCVASTVSIIFTFRNMFNLNGVVNQLLNAQIPWMGADGGTVGAITVEGVDPFWTQGIVQKCVIIIMSVWKGLGGTIILYIAGLSGVNAATKEAAQIDGANGWTIFWKVTMPDLYPVIFYNIVTAVIGGMQIYAEPELFFATGSGGPNIYTSGYVSLIWYYGVSGAATIPNSEGSWIYADIYNPRAGTWTTSQRNWQSLGAAYGMVLAIIIFVLTLFQFWLDSRNKD